MFRFIIAAAVALLPVPVLAQSPDTMRSCSLITDDGTTIGGSCKRDDIIVTAIGAEQGPERTGQAITVVDRALIESRQTSSVSDLLATTPGITISRNGGPGQPTAVRIRGAEDAQTLVLIDGVRVNDPASPAGAFDFGNLLVGNIERIEVLRGPNSVPWGSQALGGVVNIVTAPIEGARLSAEYGYKNRKSVVGQAGGRFGPVTASLGGGYFDDDAISAYRFGAERDGYRQYAANARIGVDLSDDISLDLRGSYADSRVAFDGFPPPLFAFADTSGFGTTKQAFGYAGINAKLFDGALANRLAFTIADTRRRSFSSATATPSRFDGRIERFEYQGDARPTDWLRTVFGIEREDSRFGDGTNRYSTGVTSGYLQAIVEPIEALTLTGGVRVDDHRSYGTKTTFSGNAALRIGRGTILRASYGEGFKAPTLFQLFSAFGAATLQPETARSYDAGIEQSLLEGVFRFGATVFHRDTVNQIDFAFVPPRADRPFGYYANIARTRATGVETFVELRPSKRLALVANYTLTDATNRVTNQPLLRRPKHSINASLDWDTPLTLRVGADVRTVSDSADSDFRTFSPTTLDGHTLVTLRAAMPVGKQFEVFGRVENLFDATYETVSGYGTYGRNAHVGVRARF